MLSDVFRHPLESSACLRSGAVGVRFLGAVHPECFNMADMDKLPSRLVERAGLSKI